MSAEDPVLDELRRGVVIPAHPLALDGNRQFAPGRQRALSRYYVAAGAGGLAVGVHTTQFNIRAAQVGLLRPVLQLAAETMDEADRDRSTPLIRVAGVCGDTRQAVHEASLAKDLGYRFGLLSLAGLSKLSLDALIEHCRAVAEVIELFGFYLQPSVGGIDLPLKFWRRLCEIDDLRAIKAAPFDRYRTQTVVRAVVESCRDDVALYTGNDDNIVGDLLTPYRFHAAGRNVDRRFVGGLLGQWAVDTSRAVELLSACHKVVAENRVTTDLLRIGVELTDMNATLFDAANGFHGCIAGINEVLRRQGLLQTRLCLDAAEDLSPGQAKDIDRVRAAYAHLTDDDFIKDRLESWLQP